MCIIASVPAGALLTEDMLSEMWTRNPDGGGISYFKDNEIVTEKSMDRKKFIAKVLDIQSCLLYTSPSPRDLYRSRMPSSA